MKRILKINTDFHHRQWEFDTDEEVNEFKRKLIDDVNKMMDQNIFEPHMFEISYKKDEEDYDIRWGLETFENPFDSLSLLLKQNGPNEAMKFKERLDSNDISVISKCIEDVNYYMMGKRNRGVSHRPDSYPKILPDILHFSLKEKMDKDNATLVAEVISSDKSEKIITYLNFIFAQMPYIHTRYDLENPQEQTSDYYHKIVYNSRYVYAPYMPRIVNPTP